MLAGLKYQTWMKKAPARRIASATRESNHLRMRFMAELRLRSAKRSRESRFSARGGPGIELRLFQPTPSLKIAVNYPQDHCRRSCQTELHRYRPHKTHPSTEDIRDRADPRAFLMRPRPQRARRCFWKVGVSWLGRRSIATA